MRGGAFFSLLILLPMLSMAMRTDIPQSTVPARTIPWHQFLDKFGFASGGALKMSLKVNPSTAANSVYLLGCTKEDVRKLSTFVLHQRLCLKPPTNTTNSGKKSLCPLVQANPTEYSQTMQEPVYYYFFLVSCPGAGMSFRGHLTLVNPGGEYLSEELIPYPRIYQVAYLVWLPFLLIWIVHHRRHAATANVVQRALLIIPASKVVVLFLIYTYFEQSSTTGQFPAVLPYLFSLAFLVFNVVFYGILMIFAKGLYVTRDHLPWQEVKSVFVSVLGYSITIFCYSSTNLFLWAFWLTVFIIVSAHIMNCTRHSLRILRLQQDVYSNAHLEQGITIIVAKTRVLRRFLLAFAVYFVCDLASHVLLLSLFQSAPWVSTLIQESLQLVFVIICGYWLRLTPENEIFASMGVSTRTGSPRPIAPMIFAEMNPNNDGDAGQVTVDRSAEHVPPPVDMPLLVRNPGGKMCQFTLACREQSSPNSVMTDASSGAPRSGGGSNADSSDTGARNADSHVDDEVMIEMTDFQGAPSRQTTGDGYEAVPTAPRETRTPTGAS